MSATNSVRNRLASLLVSFAATLCLLSSVGVSSGVVSGAQQVDGTVSGHVYRADTKAPLANAVVTLSPCYIAGVPWSLRTTTGADGSYTVSGPPFCYSTTASAPGFVPQNDGSDPLGVNLSSGKKVENVDFHLAVAAVISGSISYGSQPVANVGVSAVRRQYSVGGESHPQTVQFVMTDDQGKFRLDALPEGEYFVCVDAAHETAGATGPAPGWTYHRTCYPSAPSIEKAQHVHATTGKETGIRFRITADKTYTIVAEVQGADAANASRSYLVELRPSGMTTYGSRGNVVTIPQIFPGTYTLIIIPTDDANHQPVGQGSQTLQVVDKDVHVIVPIGKGGEVRGRVAVQSSGGISLSNMQLVLQLGSARSPIGADGSFDLQQVVPGQQVFTLMDDESQKVYLKQVRCSGRDYTTEPLTVQPGELVSGCDVTLAADTGAVSGSVSKDNKPSVSMVVVLIPQSLALRKIRRYTLNVTTDAVGHFQVEDVIPGDYFFFALSPYMDSSCYAPDFADRNQSDAQNVSVKPNETRLIHLRPTTPQ